MPFISKQKQREYQREYQRRRRESQRQESGGREHRHKISPETKMAIGATAFFVLALLGLLSFFDLAGPTGEYVKEGLAAGFGWGASLFPLLLAVLGFLFLRGARLGLSRPQIIGLLSLFLSVLGLLHHAPGFVEPTESARVGEGGGWIGLAMAKPLASLLGYWGGWVFLVGLLVVGCLLLGLPALFARRQEEEENTAPNATIEGEEAAGRAAGWGARLREIINGWRYRRLYNQPGEDEPTVAESVLPEDDIIPSSDSEAVLGDEAAGLEEVKKTPMPKIRREIKIPIDLLNAGREKPSADDIEATKEKIARTLATFGIAVEMGEVFVGPTITQYTLRPADGVKLTRITALANDLALALAAHPLRIEAPIPGKSLVGIEVPNRAAAKVKLKDILQSSAFRHRASNLSVCLGLDVAGKAWVVDLEKMPHLLIAGSTGSGKSVAINALVVALMYQNSPDDLKFILVDPKKVELPVYNDIPYLLTPVITDVKKTVSALKWTIGEMERRYILLSQRGKRNLAAYNAANKAEPLPYIVFVIDELADLMSVAANEVEGAVVRLAQMARAVGIHLVLATQRPSVNVLTGLIKANVPSRIAFSVPSQIDSRTILDTAGAEKLLGRGDMLFLSPEFGKPRRLQGAYLEDEEIERVVNFLKQEGGAEYQEEVTSFASKTISDSEGGEEAIDEPLYLEARQEVMRAGKASASLLQRRLRVGYARAARLLDLLEDEGVIGPLDGAKPREVFVRDQNGSASGALSDNNEDFL